jgi:membrane associated rhomboid family serine protease
MLLPIATDTSVRRMPWVNYGLIGLCVLVYLAERAGGAHGHSPLGAWITRGTLSGEQPRLYQFITYQFLHADVLHLAGNMLFLWLFGNAVNAKMGNLAYLLFYLAGGEFAAIGYLLNADHMAGMRGASGAIAAVTTAYLVLFPRSRITILYWWFFIGTFELPSMVMIVAKMIIWDNVVAPGLSGGGSNVAFDAHLAGYGFGFLTTLCLLTFGIFPRDQFDMVALVRRWFRRETLRRATPGGDFQPPHGGYSGDVRVARPITLDDVSVRTAEPGISDPAGELRARINEALDKGDREAAAGLYEKLLELDPRQVLGRQAQLDVAGQMYTLNRFPQAAAAYEKFLAVYPSAPETVAIKLLLGIIYARDLHQYEVAREHLSQALPKLTDDRRREQASHWLKVADEALAGPG